MNIRKDIEEKQVCITCMLILAFILVNQITTAQGAEKAKAKNAKDSYSMQVWRYFKDKYPGADNIRVDMQKTPYGPKGDLHMTDINTPAEIIETLSAEDKFERARAIAQWFTKEEAVQLGIKDINEIRERLAREGAGGGVVLRYDRYVGDVKLDGALIAVNIDSDENIQLLDIVLVPAPPELYKAVKKQTITKSQAREIAVHDLESEGGKVSENLSLEKIAVSSPPYVVWEVRSHYIYRINAFTGEIMEKRKGWIED